MQTLEDFNDVIVGTEWVSRSIPGIRFGLHSMTLLPDENLIDSSYRDYRMGDGFWLQTVSYTHLTLPTKA